VNGVLAVSAILSRRQGLDGKGVDRSRQFLTQGRIDRALTRQPSQPLESGGNDRQVEMAFAAGARVDPTLMVVARVTRTVIHQLQTGRSERPGQFFANNRRDRAFRHERFLDGDQFGPTLRCMPPSFQYRPRFTDIRVKPPKPEEEAAAPDVLHLKPGEKPCQWPDCRRAASARAPKSRERLNEFYDFCQGHAAEYNKGWNFYAGMSEGEIRAQQENEAMTGGRPTWEMKAGKGSREAAAFAAKMGTANTKGAGSWQDSFGLFGRRVRDQATPEGELHPMGKLERAALLDLDLDHRADKATIKARYHELLKRFHPDLNQGDRGAEAKLQRVIKAYKTLKKAGMA
jgi:hypothetical protein